MPSELHPDIEATLCDWLKGCDFEWLSEIIHTPNSLQRLYNDFLSKYRVDDWGIELKMFSDFLMQVFKHERCSSCGANDFPYFLAGDKDCIRCLT